MQDSNHREENQIPRMVLAQVRLFVNDNRRVMAVIFFTDDHVSVTTERSDAIVIVVSEETGDVSICLDGMLKKYEDLTTLKADLESILGLKPVEIEVKHKNIFDKLRGK